MSQDHADTAGRKPRGRPPSAAARRKALTAAHEILMREGFGRVTIEAVAARSGVGKPTIYRNWANSSELAMAALMANHPDLPPQGGDWRAALRQQLRSIVQAFATTRGRQIGLALATADPDSEMTRAFRNRVVLSGREAGRRLIEQSVAASEIVPAVDIEVLLDMIYGPVFYRLLVGHMPLDQGFADSLANLAGTLLEEPQGRRVSAKAPTRDRPGSPDRSGRAPSASS